MEEAQRIFIDDPTDGREIPMKCTTGAMKCCPLEVGLLLFRNFGEYLFRLIPSRTIHEQNLDS
jgi:hypothetical protein